MTIARALFLVFTALFLAGAAAAGAQEDPLKSAACGQALASLQAARRSPAASAAGVEALRATAATTCLGSGAPPLRPGRVQQPPVSVPPPRIELPARAAPLPGPTVPPPPVAIGRPPSPALCDVGGCWTSDGTHLRLVTPSLVGPAGLCTRQGGVVYCP